MIRITSGNPNVPSHTGTRIFRVFCAKRDHVTSDRHDLKLNLPLYQTVLATRNKALALHSGVPGNDIFSFTLPRDRIGVRRWTSRSNHEK